MNFQVHGMLGVHLSTESSEVLVNGLSLHWIWGQKYCAAFVLEEPWDQ